MLVKVRPANVPRTVPPWRRAFGIVGIRDVEIRNVASYDPCLLRTAPVRPTSRREAPGYTGCNLNSWRCGCKIAVLTSLPFDLSPASFPLTPPHPLGDSYGAIWVAQTDLCSIQREWTASRHKRRFLSAPVDCDRGGDTSFSSADITLRWKRRTQPCHRNTKRLWRPSS